ncbi:RimK family alpha-L-glutamate ligase [Emticicia sp.]|uniref:ATP-grasp domain-containing protein n=1 Tax=Emticicia sp. TaxID=1930953 RepID=UPI00375372C5
MKKLNILILATGKPSTHLIKAIELRGHTWVWYTPEQLYLLISDSVNGFDRIYNGSEDLATPERLHANKFDAVITRLGGGLNFATVVLAHLTENLGIYCPQTPDGILIASNKIRATQKFSVCGLKVPITVMAKKPFHPKFLVDKVGGLPAVAKTPHGSQGSGVGIMRDAEQTNCMISMFHASKVDLLFQSYIEGGKKDIRAIVVGDKVAVAMERTAKDTFKANLSLGGSGRKIELSKEDQEICVSAAKACNLEFAGIDIMKDQSGTTFLIEGNSNPGTLSIGITGINWFEHLIKHIEIKVGGKAGEAQKVNNTIINMFRTLSLSGIKLNEFFPNNL